MNVRQNTARTITLGPVLDADGVAKTDEVVASVKIHKNGGAAAALDGSATLTHSQSGFYLLALTANDLDTLGCAEFSLNSGTNSMPPVRLNVLTQDAWDALHTTNAGGFGVDWARVLNKTTTNDLSGTTISTSQQIASVSGSVGSVTDKTGYKLASDGLDLIATTVSGVASTFPQMLVQVWRRFFKKADRDATTIQTYADDGTTVLTEQTISDAGGVETQGAASEP